MAKKKKGKGWFGDTPGHRKAGLGQKVPWAKRHQQKPGPRPQVSEDDVWEQHAARSEKAQAIDEAIQAEEVMRISDPEARYVWSQDPAQMDLDTLDTAIQELKVVEDELIAEEEAAKEVEEELEELQEEIEETEEETEISEEDVEEAKEDIEETKEKIREKQEETIEKQAELEDIKAKKTPEDWQKAHMKSNKDRLLDNYDIENPIIAMNLARLHRNAKQKQPDQTKDFDTVVWEQVIHEVDDPTKEWPTLTERAKDEFHMDPDKRVRAIYKSDVPPELSEAEYDRAMDQQTKYIADELDLSKTKAQKIAQGEAEPTDFMSESEVKKKAA